MINGTWGDEEDENDKYVDDELSMMKKMTNPTEPVNLRIERSPPPRLHLHTQGRQPAKIDNHTHTYYHNYHNYIYDPF